MKSLKLYLAAGIAVLILYIVVQYNRPKPTNWTPTYIDNQTQPYGTFILRNQLSQLFPATPVSARRQPVYDVLSDSVYKNSAYLIICDRIELTQADFQQLKKYVKAGNEVFIAADDMGSLVGRDFKTETQNMFVRETSDYITFVNPALDAERQYYVDRGAINNYFTELDSAKAVVLGQNSHGNANFVRYKIGAGSMFLCANPKLFTNYGLFKSQGSAYAAAALSYLKDPKHLIWDEYYTQGSPSEESPMRVFLNNNALRSAYYIALVSLLVFVLYEIKRRQRIIPVIEPLKNSTVDFVNVIGQVYYERRNNQNIAHKKIMYFLTVLRERYQLKTSKLDHEFATALAHKTGIPAEFATGIITYMNYIGHQERVTDHELIELNALIEKFYTLSA